MAQIRMQRLVVKAYNAFPNPDYDAAMQADFHGALAMTVTCLRKELEGLKEGLPPGIQNHCELFPCFG